MDFFEIVMNNIGLPLAQRIKHWPISKYMRELDESQWWSRGDIDAYQDEKLRKMVHHAYNTTSYYRSLFDANGLTPNDIKTKSDLHKIPILQKNTIKKEFSAGTMVSTDFNRDELILGTSSGSTGEPVKYYWTREEKGLRWALIFRYRGWAGWKLGRKWVIFNVGNSIAFPGVPILGSLEEFVSRMLVLPGKDFTADTVGKYVKQIREFEPVVVKGYPSTFFYIARYLEKNNLKLGAKAAITNGETLYPAVREYIESNFGCGIYDHYGSEGVETAAQCAPHNKYHISAETVITEVVDTEGNPVPAGTEGRLLVTSLSKWAFPFIRYDTQDIAALSDEHCPCGRGLPLIDHIKGRSNDISILPSGKLLTAIPFNLPFARVEGIEAWQLIHECPSELTVRVVLNNAKREEVENLVQYIQNYCGDDVNVRLDEVDDIPLTPAGKRRYFISKCSPFVANNESDV